MKFVHAALAALVAVALAGCYPPTTTKPVGIPAPDNRLNGLWLAPPSAKQDNAGYYHFLPQKDGSVTVIMVEGKGPKPPSDWMQITLTTSRIGTTTLMNARVLTENGAPGTDTTHKGTIPILYRLDKPGRRLEIALLNEKATKAAIRAGKIKGNPGEGEDGDAMLTAGPDLDKFLGSKEGQALFETPFAVMTKVE